MMGMGSGNADVIDYGKPEEKQAPAEEKVEKDNRPDSTDDLVKEVLKEMKELKQELRELRNDLKVPRRGGD